MAKAKKTKTGQYGHWGRSLERLANEHEIGSGHLGLPTNGKVENQTYVDSLTLSDQSKTRKESTRTYNQFVAATGGFSSTNPNLTSKWSNPNGKRRRDQKAFVPRDESQFLLAGWLFSNRAAHHGRISGDESMLEALPNWPWIFTQLTLPEDLPKCHSKSNYFTDMRRKAKTAIWESSYGIQLFWNFAATWSIPRRKKPKEINRRLVSRIPCGQRIHGMGVITKKAQKRRIRGDHSGSPPLTYAISTAENMTSGLRRANPST